MTIPTIHATTNTTDWGVVASDGVIYATLALLFAAGKKCYPDLDPGMQLQSLTLKSENGSAADGSPFYYDLNRSAAPTDDTAKYVSGSGQTLLEPGVAPPVSVRPITSVWVRKTVGTDEVVLGGVI